jgi:hypothetical protein
MAFIRELAFVNFSNSQLLCARQAEIAHWESTMREALRIVFQHPAS